MSSSPTIGRRSSIARRDAASADRDSSPERARTSSSASPWRTIAPDEPGNTRTSRSTTSASTSSRSSVEVRTFETSNSAETSRSFRSASR